MCRLVFAWSAPKKKNRHGHRSLWAYSNVNWMKNSIILISGKFLEQLEIQRNSLSLWRVVYWIYRDMVLCSNGREEGYQITHNIVTHAEGGYQIWHSPSEGIRYSVLFSWGLITYLIYNTNICKVFKNGIWLGSILMISKTNPFILLQILLFKSLFNPLKT
jgi:hypothetical protein